MSDEEIVASIRWYQLGQLKNTQNLYMNEKFADTWFSFDANGKSDNGTDALAHCVPAHKALLAAASDVFEAMFYGQLKENGIINVTDASKSAFSQFLQFFYLSEVKVTTEHVEDLLYLGQKYNVTECILTCVQFLKDSLTDANVCTVLSNAIFYDQIELMELCERRILVNTAEIIQSVDFLHCDRRVLKHILKMNILSCAEFNVFEACMAWIGARNAEEKFPSNALIDTYLGDLFYEIRFASMTIQEFCALATVHESKLQPEDFMAITHIIGKSECIQSNTKFNRMPRQAKWNVAAIMRCNRELGYTIPRRIPLDTEEDTVFSVNTPLLLGSFMCAKIVVGGYHCRVLLSPLPFHVEISETKDLVNVNAKILSTMTVDLQSTDTHILLTQPILIRPRHFYKISIKKFPEEHCFFSQDLKTEVQLDADIMVKFHNDRAAAKRRFVGLVSSLKFNKV